MRRTLLVMATMLIGVLVIGGVAYALTVQCDGEGDQDNDPGECRGTTENDVITGTTQPDQIDARGGLDVVTARAGDDVVEGAGGEDDISGGVGGDELFGGGQADALDGGPGTSNASVPPFSFDCRISDPEAGIDARAEGNQNLHGQDGNDLLVGGRDNDRLLGYAGTNDLSGKGGGDCLQLSGARNEQASGGDGDDVFLADDGNADDVFCGEGHDTVRADEEDQVRASCEDVLGPPTLQAGGTRPEAEVTINGAPEEFGSQ